MDARFWTVVVIVASTSVLVGWDLYVAFCNDVDNDHDTISGILLGWSRTAWVLPFGFGVLVAHLFVPASPISLTSCAVGWRIGILLAAALLVTSIGMWRRRRCVGSVWRVNAVLVVLGLVAGHMLWFQ